MAKVTPTDISLDDFGMVEVRTAELDGITVDYLTVKQPVDMTVMLKGLPDDCCHCPHFGTIVKGSMAVRYLDGHEDKVEAGDAFHMTPGHVPTYEVGTEIVQFSPTEELKATDEAIKRNLAALQST